MPTNVNPNPNATTNLTGWSKGGSTTTLTATADGAKWVGSSSGTGRFIQIKIAMSAMQDSKRYRIGGMQVRRNSGTAQISKVLTNGIRWWDLGSGNVGADGSNWQDTRMSHTYLPTGSFVNFGNLTPVLVAQESFGDTWTGAPSPENDSNYDIFIYAEDNKAFDFTIKGLNVYLETDSPAQVAIDTNDASFTYSQSDNSLAAAFEWTKAPNEPVDSLKWSWGDGSSDTIGSSLTAAYQSPTHTFPAPGRYTVTLTSGNSIGSTYPDDYPTNWQFQTASTSQVITVPAGTFQAAYTSEVEYLKLTVDGGSSVTPSIDPVDVYTWDWGDGSAVETGPQKVHTYAAGGGYPVTLTTKTNESQRTSTVTKTITVQAAPNPANYFTATRNLLSVTFSPSIGNGTSYAWNFGDGFTDTVQQPTHVYGLPGTYTVTLTVNGNLTTSQVVTVFDAYRKLSNLNEAIRLEVATPYAAGTVYNRLPNASGAQGAYGWSTPVSGSYVTGQTTSDQPDDHGIPDAKLVYHAAGSTTQQMLSQAVRVTAGQYVGGQLVSAYVEGYVRVATDALNAAGAVLGSSALSGYQQASTSAIFAPAYLLPSGTSTARLRIEFYGTNTGGVPAAGKIMQVRNAMLSTAPTAAGVTSNPYISGRQWVDISGPATDIQTGRTELDVGTLSATVLESGYDPATSGTIRPGQPVRFRVKTEDGSGNVVWQPLWTGTVRGALVTYNNKRKASDPKSTKIVLTATDPVTQLAQKSQPNGVATIAELPAILEGFGVPYEVNGGSGQVPSANVVAFNTNASVVDQVAITRDTTGSFAFVSRAGVLTVKDSAHLTAAVSGIVDETAYSDIDASFDTQAVINSVVIKWLRYTPANGTDPASTEEITYGPYEDADSIDQWGLQPAEFTMQGVENAATVLAKANAILSANKTPQRRIKTVRVPIRYIEDLTPAKALLDLYDLVQLGYARTGTNTPARVVSVSHSITPRAWSMTLGFTPNGATAAPQATPSPPETALASSGSTGPVSAEPTELGSGVDLNTLNTSSASYSQSQNAEATTALNYPLALAGLLEVQRNPDGSMVWQRYTTYRQTSTVRVFARNFYSAVWSPWVEMTPIARYSGQASCTTALTTTTTTADVAGMTLTVPVTSTAQVFMVSIVLDIQNVAATAGNFIGQLFVGGTAQARQFVINTQTVAAGFRVDACQVWRVTGITPGSVIFKTTGQSSTSGSTHRINTVHSGITVWEV